MKLFKKNNHLSACNQVVKSHKNGKQERAGMNALLGTNSVSQKKLKITAIAALDNNNCEVLQSSGGVMILKTAELESAAPASGKENSATAINSILLVKDKCFISNLAYHELAMSDQVLQ